MVVSLNAAVCLVIVLPLVSCDKACDPELLHPSKGTQSSAWI